MKKISYLLIVMLISLFTFSCQEATKKPSKAEKSDDDTTTTTTTSSNDNISFSLSVASGNGSCSGTTCTINEKGASFVIRITLNGTNTSDTYLSMLTSYEDDMKLTDTSSSDEITLVGKSSNSQGGSISATVLTRNVTKCSDSYSLTKCSPSLSDGKNSSPSATGSSWDNSTSITINTDSASSTTDSIKQEILYEILKKFDQDGSITQFLDLLQKFKNFKNDN